jgi:hypothetical protein
MECPICLCELSGTTTTVGCCKKQFHTECLLKCTQLKNECPMCRVRECIVFVPPAPEPQPQPQPEPVQQQTIVQAMALLCIGSILATMGIVALKSYMNM